MTVRFARRSRRERRTAESGGAGVRPAPTELRFVHDLADAGGVGDIGPGWEYYLDMLTASREGTPQPVFDDYYPSQQPYFEDQATAL